MIHLISSVKKYEAIPINKVWDNEKDQTLAYRRGDLFFVFNFNPEISYTGHGFLVPPGKYKIVLNTDDTVFGGFGSVDNTTEHFTVHDPLYAEEGKEWLKLYLPARTAMVLKLENLHLKGLKK
jgi:1,4-alpha-glucan branching enzyme